MRAALKVCVVVLLSTLLAIATLVTFALNCPESGLAFSHQRREFHRLKNRTILPRATDFDNSITLASLLQNGEDATRFSTFRAARLEGYVVSVAAGPWELVNCYLPCHRDVHIHIGLRPDAPAREQVVVETTPRMDVWARHQRWDWSEATLKQSLVGHYCRFEGWLFFDSHHASEAENTAPGKPKNWRATAWEIHPVTKIEVMK